MKLPRTTHTSRPGVDTWRGRWRRLRWEAHKGAILRHAAIRLTINRRRLLRVTMTVDWSRHPFDPGHYDGDPGWTTPQVTIHMEEPPPRIVPVPVYDPRMQR